MRKLEAMLKRLGEKILFMQVFALLGLNELLADARSVRDRGQRILDILLIPDALMDRITVGLSIDEMSAALTWLETLERKLVVSLAASDMLYIRTLGLSKDVRVSTGVLAKFNRWEALRQNGQVNIVEKREALIRCLHALCDAEALTLHGRTKGVLVPKPSVAKSDNKRDKRLRDQQIRARLKGPQRSDDSKGRGRKKAKA